MKSRIAAGVAALMLLVLVALCAGCNGMTRKEVGATALDVVHTCGGASLKIGKDIVDAIHSGPVGWAGSVIALWIDGHADYVCIAQVVREHIALAHALPVDGGAPAGLSDDEASRARVATGLLDVFARSTPGGAR